ncbi:hypothetical protein B0H67DRAFT_581784 [Lasiosphaeris hirsuta]|uniref:Uncharacterized protein n=1 Tax=Lasiosphaeris hirsuta TaxID=260670 RepID=A0AA40AHC0_9PEZI|nr:hypothetical protein B0H67DRAFT_581784 [Lasiosphaeris hirsuta]
MLSRGLRLPQALARQWQWQWQRQQQQLWRAVAPMAAAHALAAFTAIRLVTTKPRPSDDLAPAPSDELDDDPFEKIGDLIRDPFSVPGKRGAKRPTKRRTAEQQGAEQNLTPKERRAARQRAKRQERARQELARQGKPWVPKDTTAADLTTSTVLVFSSACATLLESDFFRLARQGQHVDGWAAGIDKVVQVLSPTTREPQGQYFVFFDTRAAAEDYAREITARHQLTRSQHPPSRLFDPPSGPAGPEEPEATPQAPPSDAVKSYTLLPPNLSPSFALYSYHEMLQALAALPAPRPRGQDDLWASLARDNNSNRVLVKLDGSLTTCDAMRAAIVADGRERNLIWRLREGRSGAVRPVGEPVAIKRSIFNEDEEAVGVSASDSEDAGLKRFIVYLADAVEARRFAREWHKRELLDARTERAMVVNTTWLW